ncbi:hypothetical protein HDU99_005286, partial [Rhizoclosmatium hyalinum]
MIQPTLLLVALIAVIAYAAEPAVEGGVCGGNTAEAPICAENLDCISNGSGSTGICKRKVSDVGGPCEQYDFPNTSAICKAGLDCNPPIIPAIFPPPKGIAGKCLERQVSGLGGVCQSVKRPIIVCGKDLICVPASIPLIGPINFEAPSTCQPTPRTYSKIGEICGGPTPNMNVCDIYSDCVVQSDVVGSNTGICSIKTSEAGGP